MSDNRAMPALAPRLLHPTQEMALRPMHACDLDAVVLLEQQVYPHPWTRGNFADALAAGYHAQCVHQDGELWAYVVAMAGVQEAHLLNITVARPLQGQGLGRLLWRHLCAWAPSIGAERIWLEVRRSNTAARDIYTHWGFETVGERKNYYPAGRGQREDAVVMGLTL
jgi:ribosomal-protein-alanine N-acetyltransferase